MSADLQLRLPILKILPDSDKIDGGDSDTSCLSEEEHSRTPKSPEHMIPPVLCCPAAPRKPRRRSVSCKRKLCELEFFEVVAAAEIESFFRTAEESIGGAKRRCIL